jgi:hypothetical protein
VVGAVLGRHGLPHRGLALHSGQHRLDAALCGRHGARRAGVGGNLLDDLPLLHGGAVLHSGLLPLPGRGHQRQPRRGDPHLARAPRPLGQRVSSRELRAAPAPLERIAIAISTIANIATTTAVTARAAAAAARMRHRAAARSDAARASSDTRAEAEAARMRRLWSALVWSALVGVAAAQPALLVGVAA